MFRDCIDTNRPASEPWPARSRLAVSTPHIAELLKQLGEWRERARSRHLLQQLDDRMLRDVGLSRADVARECAKNFWQR
jgi:uncharacterized protein YjiS (DUF1127 family)